MHVTGLFIYPVKGTRGLALTEANVEPRGLQHDRRWMLVDADGVFLTQREHPVLTQICPAVTAEGLRLEAPGQPSLSVAFPEADAPTQTVEVWRSRVPARIASEAAHAWLSAVIGAPTWLVWMPDTTRRTVNPDFARGEGIVSFADGYPLLLANEASLADLNRRLAEPVPMDRFRPNVVIAGAEAFAEDSWQRLRIGGVGFHAVKPCKRCLVTTTDQQTGERHPKEPLRTLATYRRHDGGVIFGENLIPAENGMIRVGDEVELIA